MQKLVKILEIVKAVGPIIPHLGTLVVGAVSVVVSRFLHGSEGKEPSTIDLLVEQLKEMWSKKLREEGVGMGNYFQHCLRFLNNMKLNPTSEAIKCLRDEIKLLELTQFLGELRANIESDIQQGRKDKGATNFPELLERIRLFCALSGMYEVLVYHTLFLISNSQDAGQRDTVHAFKDLIPKEKEYNKKALQCLHRPSMEDLTLASVYSPGEYPEIYQYLEHLGVPFPRPHPLIQEIKINENLTLLTSKVTEPILRKLTTALARIPFVQLVVLGKTIAKLFLRKDNKPLFKFEEKSPSTGLYRIIFEHDGKAMDYYKNDLWRVILTDNNKVLLFPKGSPGNSLYLMIDSDSATREGDPREEGYWKLTMRYGQEIIQG